MDLRRIYGKAMAQSVQQEGRPLRLLYLWYGGLHGAVAAVAIRAFYLGVAFRPTNLGFLCFVGGIVLSAVLIVLTIGFAFLPAQEKQQWLRGFDGFLPKIPFPGQRYLLERKHVRQFNALWPSHILRVVTYLETEVRATYQRTSERIERAYAKTAHSVDQLGTLIERMERRLGTDANELAQLRMQQAIDCREELRLLLKEQALQERRCKEEMAPIEAFCQRLREQYEIADELQGITAGLSVLKHGQEERDLIEAEIGQFSGLCFTARNVLTDVADQAEASAEAGLRAKWSSETRQELTTHQ